MLEVSFCGSPHSPVLLPLFYLEMEAKLITNIASVQQNVPMPFCNPCMPGNNLGRNPDRSHDGSGSPWMLLKQPHMGYAQFANG